MQDPKVIDIFIAADAAGPLRSVTRVQAVAGQGLIGDRYFDKTGTFSKKEGGGREITLIESEAIEALTRDYKIAFTPAESRRNILTQDVALNHLVGKQF